jgi:hypothetical protein
MDYRITDAVTDLPAPADDWHCERLLRLPDSQWCFGPFGTPAIPGPLPAREAGFVTFGSFNNLTRVSDNLLRCRAEIIKVPASHLRSARIRSAKRAAEIVALFGQSGMARARPVCAVCGRPAVWRALCGRGYRVGQLPVQRGHDDLRVALRRRAGRFAAWPQRCFAQRLESSRHTWIGGIGGVDSGAVR